MTVAFRFSVKIEYLKGREVVVMDRFVVGVGRLHDANVAIRTGAVMCPVRAWERDGSGRDGYCYCIDCD